MDAKISVSMMCAPIGQLINYLDQFKKMNIEYLHIDIMDGEFVPNYASGIHFINQLRDLSDIPLDIHLMVKETDRKIEWFDLKPNDYMAIHIESTVHLPRSIAKIHEMGAKVMVALNPATPLVMLEELYEQIDGILIMTVNPGFAGQNVISSTFSKIKRIRQLLNQNGFDHIEIEVDGNVSFENAVKMRSLGANVFVAGSSSIFSPDYPLATAIMKFRNAIL